MDIIKGFAAAGNRLTGPSPIVPSGNVATVGLHFLLSDEWDDLSVRLIVHKGGLAWEQTLNDDGTVAIPAGVLESSGSFDLGLAGYVMNDDDELVMRLSTNRISGRVIDGAYVAGMMPGPGHDDPSDWERLLDHLTDFENPHRVTAEQVGTYTADEIDDKIAGVSIEFDGEMSDTSENGVQNKIIKSYVDGIAEEKLDKSGGTVTGDITVSGDAEIKTASVTIGQYNVTAMSAYFGQATIVNAPDAATDAANKRYVDNRFNGANKAVSYASYSAMVAAVNAIGSDAYNVGQNVYIVSLGVPDLWVSAVNQTSVPYVYTDDDTIKAELEEYGYITAGYYRLSALETQKVDLTQFGHSTHTYTKADGTTITEDAVVWQS